MNSFTLVSNKVNSLNGEIEVPGDKSISHRLAMLGAIATGQTIIRRFSTSSDCLSTVSCLRQLGIQIEFSGSDSLTILGQGLRGLKSVNQPLDAGNSGTTMRLLSGILGGQNFMSEGTVPREWSYIDGTFVKSINKLYGQKALRTYPNATIYKIFYYTFIKGIKQVPFLNYYLYKKDDAQKVLERNLNWSYYGCLLYTSPSTRDATLSRMPSSA